MTDEFTNATQGERITLSRTQFFALCTVILLLVIALILCWRSREPSPPTSDFEEAINAGDVAAVVVLKDDGKFKLFDTDEDAIQSCGRVDDKGAVPATCDINGKITHVNSLTVWRYIGSDCMAIYEAGDYLYDIHTEDDPDLRGNQEGKTPCHHNKGATHSRP